MSNWYLYLNVGNTTAQAGVWVEGRWAHVLREETDKPLELLEATLQFPDLPAEKPEVVATCFSRSDSEPWLTAIEARLGSHPLILGKDFTASIQTCYRDPEQLGADRAANILAAVTAGEHPCLILDAGTCLTGDLVGADGVHLGGAIAPGLPAARAGILAGAPHLAPHLRAVQGLLPPAGAGVDTAGNLSLGLELALVGTAQALIDHLRQMTECPVEVILTGGDARLLEERLRGPTKIRGELTLDGLRLAHEAASRP